MKTSLSVEAPCKINLHLRIKGLREDGFHDLESVFLALAFGDTLHFEVLPGGESGGIEIELQPDPAISDGLSVKPPVCGSPLEDLPPEKNIIGRAAALFRERTGFDRPLKARLEKRVPLGAGLGGGSSDGAATLLALNALAEAGLSMEELRALAEQLGSDVPFFLSPGAAFVSGRGERIRPIPTPGGLRVALVCPGFASNTAEAYRLLDTRRAKEPLISPEAAEPSEEALLDALGKPPSRWPYRNDFLDVFLKGEDTKTRRFYASIPQALKALGAEFSGLSGSGSACFGVFTDREPPPGPAGTKIPLRNTAEEAVKSLSSLGCCVISTFPLAHSCVPV
jgi:4-diphosphocytidyl-2-C-methyl-D-erythritol kinase